LLIFSLGYMIILQMTSCVNNKIKSKEERVLEKQLLKANSISNEVTTIQYYPYDKEDLEISIELLDSILKKDGYNLIDNFDSKVKTVFGNIKLFDNIYFLKTDNKCYNSNEILYNDSEGFKFNLYFSIDKKLMIGQYAIPELIDYRTKYPEISKIEDTISVTKKDKEGENIYVTRWRDISDLKEQRKKNIETLVARNKYLFNDDKDSFDWLIKNDAFFMEQLVKRFGYTQDFELLEWVIKKTHYDKNSPEDYGSLFWVKNCDGSIKLHSNTFKILQKLYNVKTAYQILEDIKGYINYLGDEEQHKKEDLTEEQRIKILANIVYFGEQYKYTDDSPYQMMGRLRYFLSDSQVDILIKNKYFNLPKFKEWWDKADYDEYYVTECEYEGSCGTGYHPLSEKEWRAKQKNE
ncbi:hypothetical protein, partial [Capnocytophaga gingivalis]|uniref:hypothetical protein n=1 Tax=Capnocytophaga gingivalis TaxID=1017 RepID=UPI0028F17132